LVCSHLLPLRAFFSSSFFFLCCTRGWTQASTFAR
jgi:hypothetical protein